MTIKVTQAEERTYQFCPDAMARLIAVPQKVKDAALNPRVTTYQAGIMNLPAPFNTADAWVCCRILQPHTDPDFNGKRFITLVVEASHQIGIVRNGQAGYEVQGQPGLLFTFNPNLLHWCWYNEDVENPRFICLQWEVPVNMVDQVLEELVAELSAVAPLNDAAELPLTRFHDFQN